MVFRLYWKHKKRKGYFMKKAMVFGIGVSGLGAEHLLKNMGYEVILVDDKKGISSNEGMEYLDEIEIFVKSPGVPYNELNR